MSFERLGELGDEIPVDIPLDELGYLGRECPEEECLGYFKVKPGTGLTGEERDCHCPYCGFTASNQLFWTPDQIEYAKSVALQQISDAIRGDLKEFEFEQKPRGMFGIGISMKLEPGQPARRRSVGVHAAPRPIPRRTFARPVRASILVATCLRRHYDVH